jgi:hypothetical protein
MREGLILCRCVRVCERGVVVFAVCCVGDVRSLRSWRVVCLSRSGATPYTRHPAPYTLHPTPDTLHPTPYTLHPAPYTRHPAPYTLHPTPCTRHPTPYTLHPNPEPLNATPSLKVPSPQPYHNGTRWTCPMGCRQFSCSTPKGESSAAALGWKGRVSGRGKG